MSLKEATEKEKKTLEFGVCSVYTSFSPTLMLSVAAAEKYKRCLILTDVRGLVQRKAFTPPLEFQRAGM